MGPRQRTNTHSMPAQITSARENRAKESGPIGPMKPFRMLAHIAYGAIPGHSSAQAEPAHPTSTHSKPIMGTVFGPSVPENRFSESGSTEPTNVVCTSSTLPVFRSTPPGNSSTESGSAHLINAPTTTSAALLITPSLSRNSPLQSVRHCYNSLFPA